MSAVQEAEPARISPHGCLVKLSEPGGHRRSVATLLGKREGL
ncbi:hypothetical protein BVIET440_210057 [Burkholderia vietnamiensis]|nr:hypothetical protein MYA_0195 [Burkholderia sp. KJ006]